MFGVDTFETTNKGLLIVNSDLFGSTNGVTNNPRITNIAGMFNNNYDLKGSIPLFDLGQYTRIRSFTNYVEGVVKSNITNANTFIALHSSTWVPQSWIE